MPFVSPRFFEDSSMLSADSEGEFRLDSLPDGRTRVILLMIRGRPHAGVWIAGPRTQAKFKVTRSIERAFIGTIKPGWATALLDLPASELTDQIIPLESLWGAAANDMSSSLTAAPNTLLERFTTIALARPRARSESSSARLARHAVRLLEAHSIQVKQVAERLGVTPRHLRRAFVENVGVGPKDFSRATRMQRALRYSATNDDWGGIAINAGYFDQAHLSADFKALLGFSPTAFQTRTEPSESMNCSC